jgi:hypothetical protein
MHYIPQGERADGRDFMQADTWRSTGTGKGRTSTLVHSRPLFLHRRPLSTAGPIECRPVQRGNRPVLVQVRRTHDAPMLLHSGRAIGWKKIWELPRDARYPHTLPHSERASW